MSDRVLASPGLRAIGAALSVLRRQWEPAAPAKRQFRQGGLDQVRSPGAGRAGFGEPRRGFGRARAWLRTAWRRYRSRQQIAHLNAAMLRDIGVTYAEAEAEANKPFWRG